MAKKTYIGVSNVARRVKKIYTGVGGIARNVKKGYIGVNGIARMFFTGIFKEVFKPNVATLSRPGYDYVSKAATSKYLLWHARSAIDAFNKDLVKTNPSVCTPCQAAAAAKNHHFFAGYEGSNGGGSSVGVYDKNLTRSSAPALSIGVMDPSGVSVGEYAIFGGGTPTNVPNEGITDVTAYDDALTKHICTDLQHPTYKMGTTYNREYAFFLGGIIAQRSASDYLYGADIIGYNKSLTQSIVATGDTNSLGTSVYGCGLGEYAIYYPGYGYTSSGSINNLYGTYIDESLTCLSSVRPTYGVPQGIHATNGEYAYIPTVYKTGSGTYTDHTTKITQDLVLTTINTDQRYIAGASFRNMALLMRSNILDTYAME